MICDYCGRESRGGGDGRREKDIFGNEVCGRCRIECAECGRPMAAGGLFILFQAVEEAEEAAPMALCPDCALDTLAAYAPPALLESWAARLRAERERRAASARRGI